MHMVLIQSLGHEKLQRKSEAEFRKQKIAEEI